MGLRKNIKLSTILSIFLLVFFSIASASWLGPNPIINGGWGASDQDFGFKVAEIKDQFPQNILILSDGKIVIDDWVNSRLKVYSASGTYLNSVPQLGLRLFAIDSDKIVGFSWDDTVKNERIGVFSLSQGIWLWIDKNNIYDSERAVVTVVNNSIYVWDGKSTGYQYSLTGHLIKTTTTKPMELGIVTENSIGNGQYKITVAYPDKFWSYNDIGPMAAYIRDINGNLYGYGDTQAVRYTACGKTLASLKMPQKKINKKLWGAQVEPQITVLEEYGAPFIAPNGDVYTWTRTPDKYSILKWTWVDDPNVPTGPDAPSGLTAMPSTTGIYLTWTASPQDPGCVTGYEVSRATGAGGVGTVVATVNASVLKYNDTSAATGTTYYYKVRAVAGTEFSLYTSEVSGKR